LAYDPERHHRRSIRARGFDYRKAGPYFVTIVTQDRQHVLAEVADARLNLAEPGLMVRDVWTRRPTLCPGMQPDCLVVMPDHIHALLALADADWLVATDSDNAIVGADLVSAHHTADPWCRESMPPPAGSSGISVGPEADLVSAPVAAHQWWLERMPAPAGTPETTAGGSPDARATTRVAPTEMRLGDIVSTFKSLTTLFYAAGVRQHGWPPFRGRLWQRNYYEHNIRDEDELARIRQYIRDNPIRWGPARQRC
jgi:REP element-mobilizing transposase RayT